MNLHGHIVATQSPGSTSGASLRRRSVYGFGETYGDVCPPPRHHRAPLTAPLPPSPSSWKPLLPFPQCHRVGMTQPLLGLASFTQDHARKTLAILKTKKAKAEGPACSSQDPPPPPAALGPRAVRGGQVLIQPSPSRKRTAGRQAGLCGDSTQLLDQVAKEKPRHSRGQNEKHRISVFLPLTETSCYQTVDYSSASE